jgi:hypothetical protein
VANTFIIEDHEEEIVIEIEESKERVKHKATEGRA